MQRLAVIAKIARQGYVLNLALYDVIKRSEQGKIVFIKQARGLQLRAHRADAGILLAQQGIGWQPLKTVIAEVAVNIVEMYVRHKRNADTVNVSS